MHLIIIQLLIVIVINIMNRLFNKHILEFNRTLFLSVPRFGYYFPKDHSQTHSKPGLTAKRIINCVSQRLNRIDPDRWNGVPISFNTHWRDQGGYVDVQTATHVHQALELEFGIDVKDRNVLITDIETAYYIVTQHHDSL